MFDILKWSTRVYGEIEGYNASTRLKLVNDIISQQSDELIDLSQQ